MQVNMENVLPCCGTVRQEQVDSTAAQLSVPDSCSRELGYSEQLRSVIGRKISQGRAVAAGHDEYVAGCDRLNVHEPTVRSSS